MKRRRRRKINHRRRHGQPQLEGLIPHSVDEARNRYGLFLPPGWENAYLVKSADDMEPDDVKRLAEAVYIYMRTKDIANPGSSWQDFVLVSVFHNWHISTEITKRVEAGETPLRAKLNYLYPNLSTTVPFTEDDVHAAIETLEKGRPSYEKLKYDEIVEEIIKMHSAQIKVTDIEKTNVLDEIANVVEKIVAKHEKNRWLIFLEGLIVGLITNGLYDLIKQALESLVIRAPYAEAQIYEIECDVLRSIDRWENCARFSSDIDDSASFVAMWYTLHAICVLAIVGKSVPRNPLFRE